MRDLATLILDKLGSTGIIVPLGDVLYENADRTTVTTRGDGGSFVFTYQPGARDTWAQATRFTRNHYKIPLLSFNGSTEYLSSPDAPYWSGTADGTAPNEPAWSAGFWVYRTVAQNAALMAKTTVIDNSPVDGEWSMYIANNNSIRSFSVDVSANAYVGRIAAGLGVMAVLRQWAFILCTKGTGTTAAALKIYYDLKGWGTRDSSNNNLGTYVAMENTTVQVTIGMRGNGTGHPFAGMMAGGVLGPFFTQIELTLAQGQDLYNIGKEGLFSRDPLRLPGRR